MTVTERRLAARAARGRQGMAVIDTDVHATPMPEDLAARMPARWRDYLWGGRHSLISADLVRVRSYAARSDTWPPDGGAPGSSARFIVEQLLDEFDLSYGVLDLIAIGTANTGPRGYTEAVCAAANDWLAEEFLQQDPRWLGSLNIPYEFSGQAAVKEIERWAHEKRFVQVILSMRTEKPLGDPKYWDMFEACEAHGLPVAIHPAAAGGNLVTGSGWPTYYFEDHMGYPQANPVHVASLICEGVFERFPKLQIAIVEGGWSWAPWLCGRLDSSWRVMREEVPDLQRKPSEYVREHFWFTTQPIDEPEDPRWLPELFELGGFQDRIMYASDYPHWDFDSPDDALPPSLPKETRRKILHENACRLYGLAIDAPVPEVESQ